MKFFLLVFSLAALMICCGPAPKPEVEQPEELTIARRMARYAPVELSWDASRLSENELNVLNALIEATRCVDEIFRLQVSPKNPEWLASVEDPVTREYFLLNQGPWDRLDEDEPFWGETPKPPGAGYYPEDLTKEEFQAYLKEHPEERETLLDLFTVVRRDGEKLVAVPYSEAYKEKLEEAAGWLRKAADLTENASLKKFLMLRADAFLSDQYRESDKAWMDIRDSVIDPTIGPYEVYEDKLMSCKAAFESFISVVNPDESKKLSGIADYLKEMEANLPLPKEFASPPRGSESPMRVVNLVFSGGDARAGVQTIAYNLPNDEQVRKEKGSKKVLMKNVIDAKFEGILKPIAEEMLAMKQVRNVSADAFFNEILFHEITHGMGPGILTFADGTKSTVSRELKELYPGLEEAKADVGGVYNILFLVDKGFLPRSLGEELPATYLAGMFRSIRFGIEEAHGKGIAVQFNYLKEKGAIERTDCGRYGIVLEKFRPALTELLGEILLLQAKGDYDGSKTLMDTYGVLTDEMAKDLARLKKLPVDIRLIFNLP